MKFSRYNIYKSDGSTTWIYNCLSGSFVKTENVVLNALDDADAEEYRRTLLSQGILIEDETDETSQYKYRYYKNAFDNSGLYLCIAPTMRCNFSCFYCFEEGNKNLPAMSDEVEEALIRFIESNKGKRIAINWFGGEPLLAFDRIESIVDTLNEKQINFTSSIITNGSLLTQDVIRKLDNLHPFHIQISLDGLAEVHDKRRCFKNGKPSFEVILSNIGRFLESCTYSLFIQVTTDRTNETAYRDIVELFQRKFPGHMASKRVQIGCNYVKNRTDFQQKSVCLTHDETFRKSLESLKTGGNDHMKPFLPGAALPCMYRCRDVFAIDPAGDMYKCLEHLGNPRYRVGNLLEGKLSKTRIAQSFFEEDPFEDPECKRCPVLPVCGGGCPADRLKKKEGKEVDCCSHYKHDLAELLPYLYEYRYKKEE